MNLSEQVHGGRAGMRTWRRADDRTGVVRDCVDGASDWQAHKQSAAASDSGVVSDRLLLITATGGTTACSWGDYFNHFINGNRNWQKSLENPEDHEAVINAAARLVGQDERQGGDKSKTAEK